MSTFGTIVADPPWAYSTANSEKLALPKSMVKGGSRRQVSVQNLGYPTMTSEDIARLPVRDLAEKNAHLYLWTTNHFVVDAHEIAKAWGFTAQTMLTWVKVRADDPSKASMKMGWWFRGATEHVLFCTRGRTLRKDTIARPTALMWPREPHSCKPEAFFELVEAVSDGPYLEMFARRERPGWSHWGNEMSGGIEL